MKYRDEACASMSRSVGTSRALSTAWSIFPISRAGRLKASDTSDACVTWDASFAARTARATSSRLSPSSAAAT